MLAVTDVTWKRDVSPRKWSSEIGSQLRQTTYMHVDEHNDVCELDMPMDIYSIL